MPADMSVPSKDKAAALDGLMLVNYREAAGLPLRSITRLPRQEAYALAKTLSAGSTSRRDRYGAYFDTYYAKRLRTEQWLYGAFCALGGRPKTCHPIYFTLGESLNLQDYFGNGSMVGLPLWGIDAAHISFTPRDSMHLMDMGKTNGTVWGRAMLAEQLASGGGIPDALGALPTAYGYENGYIEVQLWDDIYLEELIK